MCFKLIKLLNYVKIFITYFDVYNFFKWWIKKEKLFNHVWCISDIFCKKDKKYNLFFYLKNSVDYSSNMTLYDYHSF